MKWGVLAAFAVLLIVVVLAEPEAKDREHKSIKPRPRTPPKRPRHFREAEAVAEPEARRPINRPIKPIKPNLAPVKPPPLLRLRREAEAEAARPNRPIKPGKPVTPLKPVPGPQLHPHPRVFREAEARKPSRPNHPKPLRPNPPPFKPRPFHPRV